MNQDIGKLHQMIERELHRDEQIAWVGMPKPTYFSGAGIVQFLFAIPWTAFALFWMYGASGFKIPKNLSFDSAFALFGVPFVLIGFWLLSAPFRHYRKLRRTVYAITDQRALILEGGRHLKIQSHYPRDFMPIQRTQRSNDRGDVLFFREEGQNSDGHPTFSIGGFVNIREARQAEELLHGLMKEEE